ncbi:hypothetical protein ACLMJV_30870 [Sinorhizobium meliloti]|uniref:hypothetical protein n=1 Tax=Rhizobium meliloti TaxID=382 RepID=UPI00398D4513
MEDYEQAVIQSASDEDMELDPSDEKMEGGSDLAAIAARTPRQGQNIGAWADALKKANPDLGAEDAAIIVRSTRNNIARRAAFQAVSAQDQEGLAAITAACDPRDEGCSAPASGGLATGAPALSDLRDIGQFVGQGWVHGARLLVPDFLINVLTENGLAPTLDAATRVLINERLYTAERQQEGGVLLTQHPGAWLGDTQGLYDVHILRDFNFLRGELQTNNPGPAARTRLVEPAIAQLWCSDDNIDRESTFQLISMITAITTQPISCSCQ